MTPLRKRMIQDLELRNYSPQTIRSYVCHVSSFARYFGKCPSGLGPEHVRTYQLYLRKEKQAANSTIRQSIHALRFFYETTLGQESMKKHLPCPKVEKKLPELLSELEVLQLFGATKNKRDYVLLSLLYDTGLRVSEALNLRVSDIDSGRMVIHVRKGKGGKDRFVKLSTTLLRELRSYWKMYQPEEILFPSPKRRGQPLKITYVQRMCKKAAKQAGIKKRVYPHLLRHQAATRMIDLDTNMPTVQAVLGHSDINCTTRYIHLTKKNISGARSPLEALGILGS